MCLRLIFVCMGYAAPTVRRFAQTMLSSVAGHLYITYSSSEHFECLQTGARATAAWRRDIHNYHQVARACADVWAPAHRVRTWSLLAKYSNSFRPSILAHSTISLPQWVTREEVGRTVAQQQPLLLCRGLGEEPIAAG